MRILFIQFNAGSSVRFHNGILTTAREREQARLSHCPDDLNFQPPCRCVESCLSYTRRRAIRSLPPASRG